MRRACFAFTTSIALLAASCEDTDYATGCPSTGHIRVQTANGEPLDADEVLVELHADGITCRLSIGEVEKPEPCEMAFGVRRGIIGPCGPKKECARDLDSSIRILLGSTAPTGPVTVTLLRNGEPIAEKKFGLQLPQSMGEDCGTCPYFEHDWQIDG